jgi:hypothetical protein
MDFFSVMLLVSPLLNLVYSDDLNTAFFICVKLHEKKVIFHKKNNNNNSFLGFFLFLSGGHEIRGPSPVQ